MVRLFDILLSGLAILIFLPFCLPLALALKFTGEGEIFYFQKRIGQGGKEFSVFKFATMLKHSSQMQGGTITIKNDPRILPFGKFLRQTKINELPQLINVIKGDMSLIGPRPMTKKNFSYYNVNDQKIISKVRPGLSGLGSIIFRNEEHLLAQHEDPETFYRSTIAPYKATLECWYVKNQSLSIYFKLIIATLLVVAGVGENIVQKIIPGIPSKQENLDLM